MNRTLRAVFIAVFVLIIPVDLLSQVENIPATHPIYPFFKRMELKGIIERYQDAVLPVSRKEGCEFLRRILEKEAALTGVEREYLREFLREFGYDLTGGLDESYSFMDFSGGSDDAWSPGEIFADKEKYLYAYTDSTVSFFVDGLLTVDGRRSTATGRDAQKAAFTQFGGRIRGTIGGTIGFYLQATNAPFWGSRELLKRDRIIGQAYNLNVLNTRTFDIVDGYARYQSGILSLQVGRERVLWGNGYGDKLILSDNPRTFDFIRADASYRALSYTFIHGWLMGKKTVLMLPPDEYGADETVVPDKYFAGHRVGLSFPGVVDLGFQEMAIYSNRSPDLAYLTPITLIESAQRAREERDNVFWAFDVQTRFLRNIEFQGTILFDDINFSKWGTTSWENRYAYQLGVMVVDPLVFENISLALEYTRIEPYTFSHGRSRENDYGSLGRILSSPIGPNADAWTFRLDYIVTPRLIVALRGDYQREGENYYASDGSWNNVGGYFLQPHRRSDPADKDFLGGILIKRFLGQATVTYEVVNEIFVDVRYRMKRESIAGLPDGREDEFGAALRVDF